MMVVTREVHVEAPVFSQICPVTVLRYQSPTAPVPAAGAVVPDSQPSAKPVGPVGPVTAAPVGPVGPVGPVTVDAGPVGPGTVEAGPVGPVAPAGPVGPVTVDAAPVGPVGPRRLATVCQTIRYTSL
jgi:hypothetical protein